LFRKHSLRKIGVLLLLTAAAAAQSSSTNPLKALFDAGRFHDLIADTGSSADAYLYRGLAFARLQQPEQARQVFLDAQRKYPEDERFPVELAGVAFQSKEYRSAIGYLQRAVRLKPDNEYANNFLGSLYLLEGNPEAAVKYWNRVGKPVLDQIEFTPEPRTNPALLDRSLTIGPRSMLLLDDLKASEARIEALQVFSSPQYTLQAKPGGQFDFTVRSAEKNGFGNSKLQAFVRTLRGLPYWTIYPEYFNVDGTATNITSLLRWDPNKRRVGLTVSAPFRSRPSFHYRLFADVRDENWTLSPDTTSAFGFHSRQYAVGAALDQVVNGKWNWGVSTTLVRESAPQLAAPNVFTSGYSLQYSALVERQLLSIPERRLTVTAKLVPSVGRNFGSPNTSFARIQAVTGLNWLPGAKSGDYQVDAKVSAAGSRGTLPFSDLYMLGIERDNDLLLRGHPGTRDGKKGSSPLARDYALGNFEFTRRLFDNGLFDIRLGPFLDIARTSQTLQAGVPAWLFDPGVSLKLRVLGSTTVTFSYGRNLHDHRNACYASALR
jgi:tetratricopeptide (TPR) repeat protein